MRCALRLLALTSAFALTSCSAVPPLEPIERKQKPAQTVEPRVVQMSVGEAIEKYAPPGFRLDSDTDIDLDTPLAFDTTLPWDKAFAQSLSGAGIELARTTPKAPEAEPRPTPRPPAATRANPAVDATSVVNAGSSSASQAAPATRNVQPSASTTAPAETGDSPIAAEQVWEIRANESLQKTLGEWCKKAGCQLLWNFRDEQTNEVKDLIVGGGMRTTGSISDALRDLFKSLDEDARVKAEYRPDNYPPMLYVTRNGVVK